MKFPLFSSSASSAPLRFIKYTLVAASISLFAPIAHNPTPANAQPIGQQPPPPPRRGTPGGSQTGGGTRPGESKCPTVSTGAIAFMPANLQTTLESPTFWFYVPYAGKDIDSIGFVVLDEQDRYIQESTNIKLSGTPGFIGLRLTGTSKTLEIGKRYRWYFTIYCDPQKREDRVAINGVVERVAPNSAIGGTETTARLRITQYLEKGNRFDALNLLADLRRSNPNDAAIKAEWDKLMASFNLSNISSQPITSCCSLE